MTITVAITPQVQAELERQAAALGGDVEALASSLLESAVHLPGSGAKPSADRLDDVLREIAQYSHKIPLLPDEAFSRESIYQDHD
jgi:hypothetical protein